MSIFQSLNISTSALTAQRLRMDTIAANMANVDSTRGRMVNGEWEPYRRKMVVMQPKESTFSSLLQKTTGSHAQMANKRHQGVKVAKIVEDTTPFRLQYDPGHPEANEQGYVQLSNVDPLREMVDLISTTRSYESNITVHNATKAVLMKTLDIGK